MKQSNKDNIKAMRYACSGIILMMLTGVLLAACTRKAPERKVDCNNLRLQRYDKHRDLIRTGVTPLILENYGKGCVLDDSIVVRLYYSYVDTASADTSFDYLPYVLFLDPAIKDLDSWDELNTYAYQYELATVGPEIIHYDSPNIFDSIYQIKKYKVCRSVNVKDSTGAWPQSDYYYMPTDALLVPDSIKKLCWKYTDPKYY